MPNGSRLFSDKLDRVTFSAYFLGAVVPLVGLAVVVERFALPTLSDRSQELGLIALVVFTAILSLGSFLVLRHITRRSLDRMDGDNHRLASLLAISSKLAGVQHLTEATDSAVEQTLALVNAPAAFLYLRGSDAVPPPMAAAAGADAGKIHERLRPRLDEIPRTVLESRRPLLRAVGDGSDEYAALAVPLPGEPAPIGALVAVRPAPAADFATEEADALSTLAALAAVALHNGDLRDAQRNFFAHVTDIIVHALDAHLGFHQGHGTRVAQLANRLGRAYSFDDAAMQRLHFAALLHDIGMLRLDRSQQMNRKTCERHAPIGARMLSGIRLWKDLAPIVHHHHEWWDGSGYPDGIAGDAIPLVSRIISVCDAWDAMTSESSYGVTRTPEQALAELEACRGTQFDPGVVASFRTLAEANQLEG
jgi:putative nucleotidyltransferase with HDIG domain